MSPPQKTPSPSTLFRWAKTGRKSRSGRTVRLEVWKVHGIYRTSPEALKRFLDSVNDLEPGESPPPPGEPDVERQ